jgi:hypothetical protein
MAEHHENRKDELHFFMELRRQSFMQKPVRWDQAFERIFLLQMFRFHLPASARKPWLFRRRRIARCLVREKSNTPGDLRTTGVLRMKIRKMNSFFYGVKASAFMQKVHPMDRTFERAFLLHMFRFHLPASARKPRLFRRRRIAGCLVWVKK